MALSRTPTVYASAPPINLKIASVTHLRRCTKLEMA